MQVPIQLRLLFRFLVIAGNLFFLTILIINVKNGYMYAVPLFFLEILLAYISKRFGETTPQMITEGQVYIFRGFDPINKFLFLEIHIHEEVPLPSPNSTLDSNDYISSSLLHDENFKNAVEIVDFDVPGTYRGICMDIMKDGDFVKGMKSSANDEMGVVKIFQ